MKRLPISLFVFIVGVAVSVGQTILLGPLLPAMVASHFNINGQADGFMPRNAFLLVQWILIGFLTATLMGIPALIRITPADAINLPHKEYWLSAEQREATFTYLADRFYAFGSATLALFASISQQVFTANIQGRLLLGNSAWLFLSLYLVYVFIWVIGLNRRFARS